MPFFRRTCEHNDPTVYFVLFGVILLGILAGTLAKRKHSKMRNAARRQNAKSEAEKTMAKALKAQR
jgi:hypothetical protein